jgi:trigger factor
MNTSVTELSDSRVRIQVEVDPADVEHSVEHAAGHLAEDMRIPGFRKGKVPPRLVVQRLGRETVLDAALREFLPSWYERALLDSGVSPIGDPSLDVPGLPGAGQPLEFSIEVAVRPRATLGRYRGLEVGKAEAAVPGEAVDAELERLREGFASLTTVERAAADGDVVVIDYRGTIEGEPFDGGEGRDQLVELGSGALVDGFETGLAGASAGEERELAITFPDDYRAEELAGRQAEFAVTVKEVREKQMPVLDDDFAADASEFETLAELRQAIADRLGEAFARRADNDFTDAAIDAAAAEASIELPEEVVRARATESWERAGRALQARGVSPDAYLRMQGKSREEVIAEAMPDAERALRREATLAAIADAEGIEVTDDDLLDALGPGEGDEDPERLLRRLHESGRDTLLVEEIRMRKAAELVAEAAKPIPLEQAAARERLWTPEKEEAEEPAPGLWTPGS